LKVYCFGARAIHELKMCVGLLRRGVPTVPLAAAGQRGAESYVVCEKLEGWSQLEEMLLSESTPARLRRTLLFEYGKFARELHDAGVWQYDFNPSNVLVKEWGAAVEFKVIDFEKMRLHGRLSESVRLRSIAKINRLPRLTRVDRVRFLEGYLHKYPDEQRRIKEIVSSIGRYIGAQSERDSVRLARSCVSENRNFSPFEIGSQCGYYRKRRPEMPEIGLTFEELRRLAEPGEANGSFVLLPAEHAIYEWKAANQRARAGGELPLAVIIRRGEEKGTMVYLRKVPSS
jgi:tRNA A-37 threonylcarbamoyl transferase component Bud32